MADEWDDIRGDIRQGHGIFFRYFWLWLIILIGLSWGGTLAYKAWIRPTEINLETKAIRQSIQYQDTGITAMLENVKGYKRLETDILKYESDPANAKLVEGMRSQQRSLLDDIETTADRIGRDRVPDSVRSFLAAHEGG
ncbi:MAG: hypothetical protein HZB70_01200 [Candidatus Berkelbacteria bacterium]|nr:MAG: hypothetical protein HZB70_01200 [Candidatus Berkelbacteria bacterium]QQG52044.1 MAG: hypothetical protein HY845_01795 [Candidatus Berkelbacteria bacterium]